MSDRAEPPRLHSGGRRLGLRISLLPRGRPLGLRICLLLICGCPLLPMAATAQAAERPAGPVKPPQLAVTAADLTVASSGQQLYAIDPNAEHAIASTTKLMTALVTLQHVKRLNRVFTQMNFVPAPADSQIGLIPGEKMTVHDLLLALLIPSADDAAMDLAYNVGGGSITRFVAMMNAEAQKLGLTHTHYTTPSGLDTPGNYSSAADLSKLADYDMRHLPLLRRAVAMQSATLSSGRYVRHVETTDTLLAQYPWIQGIKTGHTDDAGYVLVSQGQRDGMTLIATVLGTDSEEARNDNALALLDYGFANFHPIKPLHRGEVLAHLPVAYSDDRAEIVAGAGYRSVVPRTDRVSVDLSQPKQLTGPLPKGTVVGHARVYVGTREVAVVPMLLAQRLPAVSLLTKITRFLGRSSTLIVLALIAFAVAAVASARHRRRTRRVVSSRRRVRQR